MQKKSKVINMCSKLAAKHTDVEKTMAHKIEEKLISTNDFQTNREDKIK